jgi:hypothetical protein
MVPIRTFKSSLARGVAVFLFIPLTSYAQVSSNPTCASLPDSCAQLEATQCKRSEMICKSIESGEPAKGEDGIDCAKQPKFSQTNVPCKNLFASNRKKIEDLCSANDAPNTKTVICSTRRTKDCTYDAFCEDGTLYISVCYKCTAP